MRGASARCRVTLLFYKTRKPNAAQRFLDSCPLEVRLRPEIVKINANHPEASLVAYVAEKIRAGVVVGMPSSAP